MLIIKQVTIWVIFAGAKQRTLIQCQSKQHAKRKTIKATFGWPPAQQPATVFGLIIKKRREIVNVYARPPSLSQSLSLFHSRFLLLPALCFACHLLSVLFDISLQHSHCPAHFSFSRNLFARSHIGNYTYTHIQRERERHAHLTHTAKWIVWNVNTQWQGTSGNGNCVLIALRDQSAFYVHFFFHTHTNTHTHIEHIQLKHN